jgi:hypothetical protein
MLTLHISCAYDQFEWLLACAFIDAHIAPHNLEHFYTLTGIILKLPNLRHFLLAFAFLHFLRGEVLLSRGSFSFYPCLCLMSSFVNKGERFWDFQLLYQGGEIWLLGFLSSKGGEMCEFRLFFGSIVTGEEIWAFSSFCWLSWAICLFLEGPTLISAFVLILWSKLVLCSNEVFLCFDEFLASG